MVIRIFQFIIKMFPLFILKHITIDYGFLLFSLINILHKEHSKVTIVTIIDYLGDNDISNCISSHIIIDCGFILLVLLI